MKRFLAPVVLTLLLVTGLAACGEDEEVLTVNGEVILDQGQMDDLLQQFADDDDWLTSQEGRGTGNETLATDALVVPVLNNYLLADVLRDELDRLDADDEVDFQREESDETDGISLLVQGFNVPVDAADPAAPTEEEQRAAVDDYIPPLYREVLIDFATQAAAFERYMTAAIDSGEIETDDPNAARRDFLTRILDESDVEVADLYGSWDSTINQIVGPEGPVAPPTTAPLAVPAGG